MRISVGKRLVNDFLTLKVLRQSYGTAVAVNDAEMIHYAHIMAAGKRGVPRP